MLLSSKSLISKIGLIVILIEVLVLASTGAYYISRFSDEIDRAMETKVLLPGVLMNRQLLRYESVANEKVMTELVGEEYQDGMVVGADRQVYYSLRPKYVGRGIDSVPGTARKLLSGSVSRPTLRMSEEGDSIASVTPMAAFSDGKPFFYLYVQVSTTASEAKKREITMLFIAGSLLCVLVTSLAIILFTRTLLTTPLGKLRESAMNLAQGRLEQQIDTSRRDELGSLARSFVMMRDAIRQKIDLLQKANRSLEQKEQRLQAFVSALPDLALVVDEHGRYLEVLSSDDRMLFPRAEALKGRLLHEVLPMQDADRFLKVVRETIATDRPQTLVYCMNVTGGQVWFEGRSSLIHSTESGPRSVIWVARDITQRKNMEDSLLQAKEEAEAANRRLLELDSLKSAFVSSVSHELRTPLTSLLGFAKLINKNFLRHFVPLARADEKLEDKAAQIQGNLEIIISEGERLTRLINDVLDLNRIESGRVDWQFQSVDCEELVRRAVAALDAEFEHKDQVALRVEVEPGLPEVELDPDRIRQVLINILHNALKFTDSGAIELKVGRDSPDTLLFSVRDTGRGIPAEETSRIFEKFYQAQHSDTLHRDSPGTGLGLAICKEIVQHHGGRIWVQSQLGAGSVFAFTLPLQREA